MAPDDDRVNASSMGGTVDLQAFENISNGWAGGNAAQAAANFHWHPPNWHAMPEMKRTMMSLYPDKVHQAAPVDELSGFNKKASVRRHTLPDLNKMRGLSGRNRVSCLLPYGHLIFG
jgi:hypothetical protein